jgi:hypothetical protein
LINRAATLEAELGHRPVPARFVRTMS